ncbi:MAG: hypothetical protein ACKO37_02920 [Vampirovibrionales bacterium]
MCFYSTEQGHRRFMKDGFDGSIYDCPVHGVEARQHKQETDDHEASVKRLAKTGIQNAIDQRDALRVFEYFKHIPRKGKTGGFGKRFKMDKIREKKLDGLCSVHVVHKQVG